jgi:sulfur transfer complex TusBCD TusB component (DsrH family)
MSFSQGRGEEEVRGEVPMTCEEFATAGLDLGANKKLAPEDGLLLAAARKHAQECAHCAALQENWLALRADLNALGLETSADESAPRVEMRLLQEFRTKHTTMKARRTGVVAAWMLAAAAVLISAISWVNWRNDRAGFFGAAKTAAVVTGAGKSVVASGPEIGETLIAANDSDEFTLVPGNMPGDFDDTTLVHVQMERGALGALGFTVNEEHASDVIQVDLLVGNDGQPQAVRLAQSAN